MNDEDQAELLEAYLDGALSPDAVESVRARLAQDPALAAELEQLRSGRAVRVSIFAAMEGDERLADRMLARARADVKAHAKPRRWTTAVRYALAAAACLVIGFVAGRVLETRTMRELTRLTPSTQDNVYRVAITDDSGRVIAVQKFDSLEQATEFSADLQRWQERQDHIRNGQVTVRSASF
jgi:anti-sigma factor RsiW